MVSSSTYPLIPVVTDNSSNLSYHCFCNYEEILEALTAPEYSWYDMHHRSFLIPEGPVSLSDQLSVETKNFIHGKVDWFKDPILAPDAFEEGNMANISPTIKINISTKPQIGEEIMFGASYSSEQISSYKAISQEFHDIFS